MREVGRELWAWLAEGAHFYVCGDAKRMAKDVERALVDIVAAAWRALDRRGGRLRRRAEEGRAAIRRTCIDRMHAPLAHAARRPHHLPLLRRRLRRAGAAGRRAAARSSPAIPIIRRISAGCARRARRSARRSASTAACCIRCCGSADGSHARASTGTTRSTTVADGFRRIVERDGPDAVAFYLSGQLLTEDYYVANKLMKGFIGSANVDTNSRLCMASSVAGHRRAFGADTVPACYEDLDLADLIVLVGSNAAWCHPVLFQRMVREPARARRQDRRHRSAPHRDRAKTPTCFCRSRRAWTRRCSAACWCISPTRGALDYELYRRAHDGLRRRARARARDRARCRRDRAARPGSPKPTSRASSSCSARRRSVVTCFSQGVNQSAQGTDKVNAIINCHLATGRIGKPGMGPFSLTGQPNAMGGREVGGLANQLAAHMGFSPRRASTACAASGTRRAWPSARASRPCRCSRRSSAARSRRCG